MAWAVAEAANRNASTALPLRCTGWEKGMPVIRGTGGCVWTLACGRPPRNPTGETASTDDTLAGVFGMNFQNGESVNFSLSSRRLPANSHPTMTSGLITPYPFDEDETSAPFDESRRIRKPPLAVFQTLACMQALVETPVSQIQFAKEAVAVVEEEDDTFSGIAVSDFSQVSRCQRPPHPWDMEEVEAFLGRCTLDTSYDTTWTPPVRPPSPPRPVRFPFALLLESVEPIGPPSAQVYKVRLPPQLQTLLDPLIAVAEAHAMSRKGGWSSELFSLTKQDMAVADIPGGLAYSRPIMDYLTAQIQILYRSSSVWMDRNQPHLLKYSAGHTGVCLHTDVCDVTANLMMSRMADYHGGGTYLEEPCDVTVHLEQGECLLHPGSLGHAGKDILRGSRYLMVMFGFLPPPSSTSLMGTSACSNSKSVSSFR
jgi:hypothetical protein